MSTSQGPGGPALDGPDRPEHGQAQQGNIFLAVLQEMQQEPPPPPGFPPPTSPENRTPRQIIHGFSAPETLAPDLAPSFSPQTSPRVTFNSPVTTSGLAGMAGATGDRMTSPHQLSPFSTLPPGGDSSSHLAGVHAQSGFTADQQITGEASSAVDEALSMLHWPSSESQTPAPRPQPRVLGGPYMQHSRSTVATNDGEETENNQPPLPRLPAIRTQSDAARRAHQFLRNRYGPSTQSFSPTSSSVTFGRPARADSDTAYGKYEPRDRQSPHDDTQQQGDQQINLQRGGSGPAVSGSQYSTPRMVRFGYNQRGSDLRSGPDYQTYRSDLPPTIDQADGYVDGLDGFSGYWDGYHDASYEELLPLTQRGRIGPRPMMHHHPSRFVRALSKILMQRHVQLSIDWFLVALLAGVTCALRFVKLSPHYLPPTELPYYSYPVVHDPFPSWQKPILAAGTPLIVLLSYWVLWRVPRWEMHQLLLSMSLAVALTAALSNCAKVIYAEPRPTFVRQCWPTGEVKWLTDGIPDCSNASECQVQDALRSFPSDHAAWTAAGWGFITMLLLDRMGVIGHTWSDMSGTSWRLLTSCAPAAIACAVGISRIMVYRHHWNDVVLGLLLGFVIAVLTYNHCGRVPVATQRPLLHPQMPAAMYSHDRWGPLGGVYHVRRITLHRIMGQRHSAAAHYIPRSSMGEA